MSETKSCPKCGAALPVTATAGLCPRCLMAEAMSQTEPNAKAAALSTEELAPHFPQLEILELIGKGGMGAVYKARQKELDRLVAVKILPCGMGVPPSFAERFAREAKALAKLNHPNIVAIYEFGRADGLFYFVMEYVDGVNLRQLFRAGRVAPREALAIVPQICDALQYAHDAGIVHRDIKPENILLDRQGRVKIADFGIAKMMAPDAVVPAAVSAAVTQEQSALGTSAATPVVTEVAGTPQYMAPEQKDRRHTDHRADIYSLGVVLYEMLTGELPGKQIEPPSKKVIIDVRLDEVVLRALEQSPERRYQTAAEVKTCVETIASTSECPPSEPTNKSGMVRIIEIFFGITFMSRLAVKLVNVSALGFWGSLGFLGYLPIPGWQRCFGFFGLSGFFGLIGAAFVIEMAARSKRGDTSLRSIIVVGRRDGKAVIHWPGVFLGFFLALVVMEVVAVVASLAMEDRINANAILIAFFSALMITGIRIRRGRTMPVDQLISLDKPRETAAVSLMLRTIGLLVGIGVVVTLVMLVSQRGTFSNHSRTGSKSGLVGADAIQDVVKDIQPDGTIRFKTTITKRNTSSEPLKTLRFYNSDFVKVEKLTDAQGRTIPSSATHAGRMTVRYDATLPEPVQPGAEHSYITEGTETGLVKRLLESDVFEYTMRHWPGTSRTRRIELHRLPAGAQLLSKQPNDLVARKRDGTQELFIDRLIPTGDSLEISYTYRLPVKP